MALEFPYPATSGQIYQGSNGVNYVFDGIKWNVQGNVTPYSPSQLTNNGTSLSVNNDGSVAFPNYTFPINDGTNNQVLSTNGQNGLFWKTEWNPGNILVDQNKIYSTSNGVFINSSDNNPSASINVPSDTNAPISITNTGTAGVNITSGSTEKSDYWWNVWGDIGFEINQDFGSSVVYDADGNLYVMGSIIDFALIPPQMDSVLLKYDYTGQLVWAKRWQDNQNLPPCVSNDVIDIDNSGNISFLANNIASGGFYIGRINSTNGDIIEQNAYGITLVQGYDMVVDNNGYAYVAGVQTRQSAPIVLKINLDTQTLIWNDCIYANGEANGIDIDSSGNIYAIGVANSIAILWKYNNSGNLLWGPIRLTSGNSQGSMVAVNGNYIYSLVDDLDNGGTIVIQHTPSGAVNWQRSIDVNNTTFGYDLSFDENGNVYVTGVTQDGPFASNLMIIKLSDTGTILWQRTFGSQNSSGDNSWVFFGHRMGDVFKNNIAITGFTYSNVSVDNNTGNSTVNSSNILTVQLPTDGSMTGSYGRFSYNDASYFNDHTPTFVPVSSGLTHGSSETLYNQPITNLPSTLNPHSVNVTENYSNKTWIISQVFGGTWNFSSDGGLIAPANSEITIPDYNGQNALVIGFLHTQDQYDTIGTALRNREGAFVSSYSNNPFYVVTEGQSDYNVWEFDEFGNLNIPGKIISNAVRIPSFVSSTDFNIMVGNRVNIKGGPINLSTFTTSQLDGFPGKTGDLVYNSTSGAIETYKNNSWGPISPQVNLGNFSFDESIMYTPNGDSMLIQANTNGMDGQVIIDWNNQNRVTVDYNGARISTGDNSWQFDSIGGVVFPDGTRQITAYKIENINTDGGSASSVYEPSTLYADGGSASSRIGVNDMIFDGGLSNVIYSSTDNIINGGEGVI